MPKIHCDKHPNIPFDESVGCEFCKARPGQCKAVDWANSRCGHAEKQPEQQPEKQPEQQQEAEQEDNKKKKR